MNIKHPELIFLILFIPMFIGFFYYIWKRRIKALAKLCDVSQLKRLFPHTSKSKVLFRYFLLSLVFTLFVTSFISPRWGYDWKEVESRGANLMIALDVSRSMAAEDIKPSRLSRAKIEINKLLKKFTGDQVGLIIFAGDAFLQCPMTHDYLMVSEWVNQLQVDSVPVRGTSISSAIKLALKSFSYVKAKSKALIIITDGEVHDEETLAYAKEARQKGVRIYVVGIGTKEGSPIPTAEGLVKDENGNIVVSKLEPSLLKDIATTAEGHYVRSTTGDFHLDELYFGLIKKELAEESLKSGKSRMWYETYQIFSGIALFLIFLEFLLTLNLGSFAFIPLLVKIFTNGKGKSFVLLFFLLFASSVNANPVDIVKGDLALQKEDYKTAQKNYLEVQVKDPHNERLNYNLGIANFKGKDYQQALNNFKKSAETASSPLLRERALYNLGNAYYVYQMWEDAVAAYEVALEIDPNDEDAKYNLEKAKEKLKEKPPPKDGDKEDENKDGDKDQKDKNKDDQNKDKEDQKKKQEEEQKKKEQDQKRKQDELKKKEANALLNRIKEADKDGVNKKQMQQKFGKKGGPPPTNGRPW